MTITKIKYLKIAKHLKFDLNTINNHLLFLEEKRNFKISQTIEGMVMVERNIQQKMSLIFEQVNVLLEKISYLTKHR